MDGIEELRNAVADPEFCLSHVVGEGWRMHRRAFNTAYCRAALCRIVRPIMSV